MSIFTEVKEAVTTRDAAAAYGITVQNRGMCRCPFHQDRTPSMKVDRRFHCFGCGADGDVIDFTARLFNLRPKEARKSWLTILGSTARRASRRAGGAGDERRIKRNLQSRSMKLTVCSTSGSQTTTSR